MLRVAQKKGNRGKDTIAMSLRLLEVIDAYRPIILL
jgi:hypothetical protein